MKVNQVIEVKPTLTEKEFLRLVLAKVASAEGAPFDVAEKIEFSEVKQTANYTLISKYRQDLEYSAIIGHNTKIREDNYSLRTAYEFTQWQEEPYIGVFSSDEVCGSILESENSESELYKWGDQADWAKSFIENEFSDETYKLSTEVLDKTFEIPSFETNGWVDYKTDIDDNIDTDIITDTEITTAMEELLLESSIRDEIPADECKNLKFLRIKKETIDNKIYKIHYYEVSYTYEGETYYAKAIANKESKEVLWVSDGTHSTPKEEKSFDEIVSDKQKAPMLLANASWILTYASAAVSIILSVLGNSSLWYLPFIMIAASTVVTIICNRVSEEIGWSVYRKYNAYSRRNNIMPSLCRGVEKLGLGELTEDETTKAMEMFNDPERPKNKKVEMGGKIALSIPLAIGAAIIAFCFGFAANL